METPPPLVPRKPTDRRNAVTWKLLFIAGLVALLQLPLYLVNSLRQERFDNRARGMGLPVASASAAPAGAPAGAVAKATTGRAPPADGVFDAYRMVERSVKHGVLVLALVFAAFFLFEMLAGLRLHAVHYSLVGAALCLFYLALLALGEVTAPAAAYVGAAVASSLLIVCYSAAILQSWVRASSMAALLTAVHSVLFVVLRMEDFALLAGTGALFAALAAIMFFTRKVDWFAQDTGAVGAVGLGAEAAAK